MPSRKSTPKCTLNGRRGWDLPGLGNSNRIYHELDEVNPKTDAITETLISVKLERISAFCPVIEKSVGLLLLNKKKIWLSYLVECWAGASYTVVSKILRHYTWNACVSLCVCWPPQLSLTEQAAAWWQNKVMEFVMQTVSSKNKLLESFSIKLTVFQFTVRKLES